MATLSSQRKCVQVYLGFADEVPAYDMVPEYLLPCGVWLLAIDFRGAPPSFLTRNGPLDSRPLNWPKDDFRIVVTTKLHRRVMYDEKLYTSDWFSRILLLTYLIKKTCSLLFVALLLHFVSAESSSGLLFGDSYGDWK